MERTPTERNAADQPRRLVDRHSGEPVWIASGRQSRPQARSQDCPFCPGGLEAPDTYEVRWFRNRWPSMDGGACEVLLYSPHHDQSLASLGTAGVRRVVDLWAERTEALGSRPDVAYVLPFENRGADVGATIDHPHGQLYAFDEVPPAARAELDQSSCPTCAALPNAHEVAAVGSCRTVVPDAARWPYELLIAPAAHKPDLPGLPADERNSLAAALADGLSRLDRVLGEPMPYMLWVHQRPTDGGLWPAAHLHVHVVGHYRAPGTARYVAAGELGSGVWFNPVDPVAAAQALRCI